MHPHHILKMPSLVNHYPNMKLILAHLYSKDCVDVIASAKYDNIYTDTSGSASALNHIIEYAVNLRKNFSLGFILLFFKQALK